MKKYFFFNLLLISSLVLAKDDINFEIILSLLGSNQYNLLIIGDDISNEKNLRAVFQKKVNEICGTRFEIISIKMNHVSKEGAQKNTLNGSFKCFVNSQM